MRDPNGLIQPDITLNESTVLRIDNIPEYNYEDWDLTDEKQFLKYISSVEKDVRTSYEYRNYITYLRDNLNMNCCSFYKNVSNLDNTRIKIEIHHEPLTLYDICIIVFNKRKYYQESLEEELVAKEVMFLHYNLLIGLIPVSETVHELIHNQYLFVPTDKVLGKYREFVDLYEPFITPEQLDVLSRIEEATLTYNNDYSNILSKNYIYIDMSGEYNFPKKEDIIQAMKSRIEEIRTIRDENLIIPVYFGENEDD